MSSPTDEAQETGENSHPSQDAADKLMACVSTLNRMLIELTGSDITAEKAVLVLPERTVRELRRATEQYRLVEDKDWNMFDSLGREVLTVYGLKIVSRLDSNSRYHLGRMLAEALDV